MKEFFKESVVGLNKLIEKQIAYVSGKPIGEMKCEVSV
jgi:hypothetical protein